MNYVKHFNMLGVEAQQIPCITGTGAPTTETEGAVGCFYMDTDNGDVYKCIKVEGDVYTWKKENEGIIEVELETEHGSDGFIPLFTKEGTVATTLDEVHSGVFKLKYPTMYETILLQTKDYVISDRVDCVNQILWVRNFIRVRVGITEIPTDYLAWDTINLKDIAELKTDKEDISNKSDTIDDTADDVKYPTTKAVKDYVDTSAELNTIVNTTEGSLVNITDSANVKLKRLKICGKTTQADVPSIENPQPLVNVGGSGSITTKVYGKNLLDISVNPILVEQADGSYVNENGRTDTALFPLDLPYGSYTMSCDVKCPVGKNARLRINLKDGTYADNFQNSTGAFVHLEKSFIGEPINWRIYYGEFCDIGAFTIKNAQLETGSVVTEYEPFKEPQTFTLNTPNGLPGVPVTSGGNYTDENGQQWICDEIDLARGKYVQRIGKYEVTGNEKWGFHSSSSSDVYYRYDCTVSVPANIRATNIFDPLCMCTHYRTALDTSDASSCCWVTNKTSTTNEAIGLRIKSTITSVNEFTQMLKSQYSNEKPVTFYYILATPVETDLTDWEIEQYKALTTHKPVTNVYNDAYAHMKVDYVADPKTYIDNKFANIENAILSLGGNV